MKFGVVVLDPPWPEHGGGKVKRGADRHYPLMPIWQIAALDVGALLLPDAHVWVWVTSSYMQQAYTEVFPSWGLTPVGDVPWVKCTRADGGSRRFRADPGEDDEMELQNPGLGQYRRMIHETLVLLKVGKPPLPDSKLRGVPRPISVLLAPRGRHSAKPVEALDYIARVSHNVVGQKLCIFAPDDPGDRSDLTSRGWLVAGLARDGEELGGAVPMPVERDGWKDRLREAKRAFAAGLSGAFDGCQREVQLGLFG